MLLIFCFLYEDHGNNCAPSPNHCSQIKRRLNDVNNCTYIEVCLETGESVNQMFQLGKSRPVLFSTHALMCIAMVLMHGVPT
jgi:hypothetical protein